MSNSKINTIPLIIRAADKGTEIFLIDSQLNRRKSSVGELIADVEPGLYKVRFRAGDTLQDRLVEVSPDMLSNRTSIEVQGSPIFFNSAAPLPATRTTHEYHENAWKQATQQADLCIGNGSRLFFLARDPEKKPGKYTNHRPWNGLFLCALNGKILADFNQIGKHDANLGYATLNVEIDPGVYVLRVNTKVHGILEMAVVACRNWQTHVLVSSTSTNRLAKEYQRTVRRIDINEAAIFMTRPGELQINDEQMRLTELARQGLAQGRISIRPKELNDMLTSKFQNPMLGILGAHLLLRGKEPDLKLLDVVIANLMELTPDHPDVWALRMALDNRLGRKTPHQFQFNVPPMLLRSWNIIVEQSVDCPDLVSMKSFTERIGHKAFGGGPWLIWRHTREHFLKQTVDLAVYDTAILGQLIDQIGSHDITQKVINRVSSRFERLLEHPQVQGLMMSVENMTNKEAGPYGLGLLSSLTKYVPLQRLNEIELTYKLTPLQRALIREISVQMEGPAQERFKNIVLKLGVPASTVISTAIELMRKMK